MILSLTLSWDIAANAEKCSSPTPMRKVTPVLCTGEVLGTGKSWFTGNCVYLGSYLPQILLLDVMLVGPVFIPLETFKF